MDMIPATDPLRPPALRREDFTEERIAAFAVTAERAGFNRRGFCDKGITDLTESVGIESGADLRDRLAQTALGFVNDEAGIIPLHQQPLHWGIARQFDVPQRADDQLMLYRIGRL